MSYMKEEYIKQHNEALDRLAKVSFIKFSREDTNIDFSNAEFFPGVGGYAILDQVKMIVFIPVVSSEEHGNFSKLLKDLELWISEGYEIVFSSVFSIRLQNILKAHGYKSDKRSFDDDPEQVCCMVKT